MLVTPRKASVTNIVVRLQKEGIHKYPAALTDPKLAEVSFLGYPHRHIFHIEVMISVNHNDRDLEFILVKRDLEEALDTNLLSLDYKSCEMISEDIAGYLTTKYGAGRIYGVSVFEDGENGSVSWFWPEDAELGSMDAEDVKLIHQRGSEVPVAINLNDLD